MGLISGTVTYANGDAAQNIRVFVYRTRVSSLAGVAITDTSGDFELEVKDRIERYRIHIEGGDDRLVSHSASDLTFTIQGEAPPETNIEAPEQWQEVPKNSLINPRFYYNGTQAELRILDNNNNTAHVLPASIVHWTADRDKAPLFKRASYLYDALMGGNYLVQGGFALDMQYAFQLNKTLEGSFTAPTPLLIPEFEMRLDIDSQAYLFNKVHIVAMSHQISVEGAPAVENYEFIARRVLGKHT